MRGAMFGGGGREDEKREGGREDMNEPHEE